MDHSVMLLRKAFIRVKGERPQITAWWRRKNNSLLTSRVKEERKQWGRDGRQEGGEGEGRKKIHNSEKTVKTSKVGSVYT